MGVSVGIICAVILRRSSNGAPAPLEEPRRIIGSTDDAAILRGAQVCGATAPLSAHQDDVKVRGDDDYHPSARNALRNNFPVGPVGIWSIQ
jgi:hypothetical protein